MSLPPPDLGLPDFPGPTGGPDGEALLRSLDHLQAVIEHVAGYRQRAVAAGFTAVAAERMALDLHAALLAVARLKAATGQGEATTSPHHTQ